MEQFGIDESNVMKSLDHSSPHEYLEGDFSGKYIAYRNYGEHLVFGKVYDKVERKLNGIDYVYYRVVLYDSKEDSKFVIGNYEETWLLTNQASIFNSLEELQRRVVLLSI
jgi:hypothetical protein